MVGNELITEQVFAGWLMILSALIFFVGGFLYTGRAIWKWPAADRPAFLLIERGFVMAALLTVVLGLTLLERRLEAAGDSLLAPSGLMLFLIGAVLALVAETFSLSRQEWIYSSIVVFIVLAFLGQAILGAALLRTALVPGWVGWVTILWSLGWLVILPIARPKNMYYPWLHYVAPLLIGITLVLSV
jgi:hypothetical protein